MQSAHQFAENTGTKSGLPVVIIIFPANGWDMKFRNFFTRLLENDVMKLLSLLFVFSLSGLIFSGIVWGGQLNVGGGYGPQSLDNWDTQNNGVIDISYTFYESKKSGAWQFLCGVGYSYVFTDESQNEDVHMISVLPAVRYNLKERASFSPFLEVTIGPSYMSDKQLGTREQGSHFIFNDFFTIGVRWGKALEWEFRYSWRHISNGNLVKPNPGWDIPFSFYLSKRF